MVLPVVVAGARASTSLSRPLSAGAGAPKVVQQPLRARSVERRFSRAAKGGAVGQRGVSYRINRPTMVLMVCMAAVFDLAQLASKVLYLVGLGLLGAAGGSYLFGSIGGWLGGALGGIITALGFGFFINMIMAEFLSWTLMFFGFITLWLWMLLKGVPVLGGRHIMGKFSGLFLAVLVEFTPLLNVVPSITWWTWRMTTLSRKEDRERHRDAKIVGRIGAPPPIRSAQNDNEPTYAYAA